MFFVAEIRATQGISKKVAKLTCQIILLKILYSLYLGIGLE